MNGLQAATAAGIKCIVTVSSYTADEDFSTAAIVLSSLGDPGEPRRVLANHSPALPGPMFGAADLAAIRSRA